jgi:hypothetical protein
MEATGIIADTRVKIEMALKDKRAFDVKTAADLQVANLDLVPVLDIMEKGGLIARTPEGKVYMTQKGHDQSTRGFKVSHDFSDKKFIRFSRNK